MSRWTIATASLLPGTTNVHSILMAYEWRRQNPDAPRGRAILSPGKRRA